MQLQPPTLQNWIHGYLRSKYLPLTSIIIIMIIIIMIIIIIVIIIIIIIII